jgi:hypothetical protein
MSAGIIFDDDGGEFVSLLKDEEYDQDRQD